MFISSHPPLRVQATICVNPAAPPIHASIRTQRDQTASRLPPASRPPALTVPRASSLSARHGDFPWIPDPGSARRLTNKRRGELAAEIVKAFRSPEKIEPLIQAEG